MPQAIHESIAFNSRNREVAIHCVFSLTENTLTGFFFSKKQKKISGMIDRSILLGYNICKMKTDDDRKTAIARFSNSRKGNEKSW